MNRGGSGTDDALRESEERLRLALESAKLGEATFDLETGEVHHSPAFARMLGFPPDRKLSLDEIRATYHPEDREHILAARERNLAGSHDYLEIEHRIVRPDGLVRWLSARGTIARTQGERPRVTAVYTDVTERKLAEERLRASERRLQTMADALPVLIAYVDHDHVYRFNNAAYESWFGQPLDQVTGRHIRDVIGEAAYKALEPHIARALSGETFSFETQVPYRDGGDRTVHVEYVSDRREDGTVAGYYGLIQDISDRKAAEDALRESEERQAFLLRLVDALRPLTRPVDIAATAAECVGEHLGMSRVLYAEIAGTLMTVERDYTNGVSSIVGEHDLAAFGQFLNNYRAGTTVTVNDVEADASISDEARAGLRDRHIAAFVDVVLFEEERCVSILAVQSATPRDWTTAEQTLLREVGERVKAAIERVRVEAALRESEERLRLVVDGATDYAIFTIDPERCVTSWSTGAAEVFGYSADEAMGMCADVLWTPEDRAERQPEHEVGTANEEGCANNERWHLRRDGSRVFLNGSVHPLPPREDGSERGFIKIARDETERRKAEDDLQRLNQRLALEGQRLADMFEQAPSLMAMLRGPDHVFEFANPGYRQLTGQRDLIGKTVREALPDVAGQGFFENLDEVYRSGKAFVGTGARVSLQRSPGGPLEDRFLDFVYQPVTDTENRVSGIFVQASDVTDRKMAEDRRAALVELADRSRDLSDPADIAFAAAEILGHTLGVSRAGYGTIDPVAETITIQRDWNAPGIRSLAGVLHFREYGSYIEDLKRGETVVFADAEKDPRTAATADALKAISAQAVVNMPITEHGGFVALLYLNHATAREWRPDELEFVREVAERTRTAVERRRVEQELRASEERFRTVFENAAIGMLELDGDWRILGANPVYVQIAGRSEEDLIGVDCLSFTHDDDLDRSRDAMRSITEGGSNRASFEKRYVRPNGEVVWIRSNLSRVSSGNGGDRFLKAVEDISDRKRAEEALREERQRLEILNRTGAALAAELDMETVVQMVTDAGVELTGAEFGAFFYNVMDNAGGSYMLYSLSGADRSAFENYPMPRNTQVFGPTFEGNGVVRADDITRDPRYGKNPPYNGMPEGHLPVRSYLAVPVIGRSGEVIGGLFFGHSEPGRFTERHERLMTGIAGQAATAIDSARLYQALQRANETLEQRVEERTAELETANEALRQSQKMEAIGQLTGGIAHDFNNMLTVIRGSADILQRPTLTDSKRQRYLEAIVETADRASRLTGQLLAFARRQALRPERFDAVERVESIAEILHTVLGSRINLQIVADCDDCFIDADAAQFETAIVNMAINARDAMDGAGELTIRVGRATELPPLLRRGAADAYVAVCVSDTGEGIPAEALDKIFEPFFTTKEIGKGTGLGLSQVYGFAKQSGGEIDVATEVGKGTSFTMYLPEAESPPPGAAVSCKSEPDAQPSGRVLVVEDNEDVGRFAEQVLAELGYSVQLAHNADEATEILEQNKRFDVVFSDVVMPGKGGFDFAREVRERWPDLPVVLTSGYSHVLASHSGHGFPLLQKPYSLEALQLALTEALQR